MLVCTFIYTNLQESSRRYKVKRESRKGKHPGKNKLHKSFLRYLFGQGDYAFGYEDLCNLFNAQS